MPPFTLYTAQENSASLFNRSIHALQGAFIRRGIRAPAALDFHTYTGNNWAVKNRRMVPSDCGKAFDFESEGELERERKGVVNERDGRASYLPWDVIIGEDQPNHYAWHTYLDCCESVIIACKNGYNWKIRNLAPRKVYSYLGKNKYLK